MGNKEIMDIWHLLLLALVVMSLRKDLINRFKVGYYEEKLKNRNCDVSNIKNIGLIKIIKIKL